jgi:multisubunit Na+/H+ antiporter MnhB subunit
MPFDHEPMRETSKPPRGCLIAAVVVLVLLVLGFYFVSDVLWQPRYPGADPF